MKQKILIAGAAFFAAHAGHEIRGEAPRQDNGCPDSARREP